MGWIFTIQAARKSASEPTRPIWHRFWRMPTGSGRSRITVSDCCRRRAARASNRWPRPPRRSEQRRNTNHFCTSTLALELPADAWQTVTWRDGSNTPLTSRFAGGVSARRTTMPCASVIISINCQYRPKRRYGAGRGPSLWCARRASHNRATETLAADRNRSVSAGAAADRHAGCATWPLAGWTDRTVRKQRRQDEATRSHRTAALGGSILFQRLEICVQRACRKAKDLGYPHDLWTPRLWRAMCVGTLWPLDILAWPASSRRRSARSWPAMTLSHTRCATIWNGVTRRSRRR
jgi:hypothetical protein